MVVKGIEDDLKALPQSTRVKGRNANDDVQRLEQGPSKQERKFKSIENRLDRSRVAESTQRNY